eukprot:1187705-Prorocentrum_minimum.AAC.2
MLVGGGFMRTGGRFMLVGGGFMLITGQFMLTGGGFMLMTGGDRDAPVRRLVQPSHTFAPGLPRVLSRIGCAGGGVGSTDLGRSGGAAVLQPIRLMRSGVADVYGIILTDLASSPSSAWVQLGKSSQ